VLQNVCIPAAAGGNWDQLAKSNGFRKNRDGWGRRDKTFQLQINNPGANPTQCHVNITHPVDPEAPGRAIVIALHDWAAVLRGWTLYRNDKSVQGSQEYTTRSWEHDDGPKHEALVLTTVRMANGAPAGRGGDTSQMIYDLVKQ